MWVDVGHHGPDVKMYANLTERIPNKTPENSLMGKEEFVKGRTGVVIGDGSVLLRRASPAMAKVLEMINCCISKWPDQ